MWHTLRLLFPRLVRAIFAQFHHSKGTQSAASYECQFLFSLSRKWQFSFSHESLTVLMGSSAFIVRIFFCYRVTATAKPYDCQPWQVTLIQCEFQCEQRSGGSLVIISSHVKISRHAAMRKNRANLCNSSQMIFARVLFLCQLCGFSSETIN